MKIFFTKILEKVKGYSKKLDDLTLLVNHHWVLFDKIRDQKTIYIFRSNNELLVSINGKITKERWEYLGNNAIMLDIGEDSYLFRNGFIDEDILALKQDSLNKFAIFINETRSGIELNSLESIEKFLSDKYLAKKIPSKITSNIRLEKGKYLDETLNSPKTNNEIKASINPIEEVLSDADLMRKYNISFRHDKYCFLDYKYDRLNDAINYAKLIEKKEKSANK